ncbi:MAG: TetR/AcrR family transcriptional regulator [Spirochaetia bacterium]|jgi:AcrR family transcriptional regulator
MSRRSFPAHRPRWTSTFDRISEDKRRRVLDCAKRAFARRGYAGTNVNLVAKEAGISVGSLYQYFKTKESLFLALIEESHGTLTGVIDEIFSRVPGFFERVEALLTAAVEWSRKDPDFLNLYIACTTEELAPLAAKLSGRIESVAAERYSQMVGEAKRRGEIDAGLSETATAFCLDNLFLIVQFSFGSAYYRERLGLFLGEEAASDAETVIQGVMSFIRRALSR